MTLTAHGAGAVATAAFLLPALGFAAGSALFERPPVIWQAVGTPDDFPNDTYVPARHHRSSQGIGEVGKTTVYVRARNRTIDGRRTRPDDEPFIAISTRCMHLGCPVRYVEAAAALHLPVPRRRLRLPRQRRPAARRCARSTASTPACATARSRSARATRSTREFKRFPSYRDPGAAPRRHRPVPLPRPLLDPEADETMPCPSSQRPRSRRAPARAAAARRGRAGRAARAGQGGGHLAPSTGSTSARRCPAACAG